MDDISRMILIWICFGIRHGREVWEIDNEKNTERLNGAICNEIMRAGKI